jgi:Tfp pilus assembly protein PilF
MSTVAGAIEQIGPLLEGASSPDIGARANLNAIVGGILGVAESGKRRGDAGYLFGEAMASLNRRDFAAAKAALAAVFVVQRRGPYAVAAHYMLGHIHLQFGNLKATYDEWKQAWKLDRGSVPIQINLAGVLIQMGDFDKALDRLRRAERSAGTRSRHLGEILEFQSFAYLFKDHVDEAEAVLFRAITELPDRHSASLLLSNLYIREARRAPERRKEMLHKAIVPLEELLARVPGEVAALTNIGAVFAEMGDDSRAIEWYRKALEAAPEAEFAARNLALALARAGSYEECVAVLEDLTRRFPDDASLHDLLGAIHIELRRLTNASRELRKVIDLGAATAATYANLGFVRAESADFDAAERYFRRALELDPDLDVVRRKVEELARDRDAFRASRLPKELYAAANELEEARFERLVRPIDKAVWSGASFEEAVRLALRAGALPIARDLARQGAERFPENTRLRNAVATLAPPTARSVAHNSRSDRRADRDWIEAHRDEYGGQWVALRNGALVAAASDPTRLVELLGAERDVFLTKVA